jgi:L-asparaginase
MADVVVLTLGGTIASLTGTDGGLVPSLGAELVTGLDVPEGVVVAAVPVLAVPSPSLSPGDAVALVGEIARAAASGAVGVVVSQGTDTIEETAFALDVLGAARSVPVAVTGAMRGADAAGADGPANLSAAVAAVLADHDPARGVVVAFADRLHAARHVVKSSAVAADAFSSPPVGPVGWVAEGRAHFAVAPSPGPTVAVPAGSVPAVAIVEAGAGDDLRMLPGLADLGYAGVVVAGMGAGHVAAGAMPAVRAAAERMPVVVASRIPGGPTAHAKYGYAGSEIDLRAAGAVLAGTLTASKARVLLGLLLAGGADAADIRESFAASA